MINAKPERPAVLKNETIAVLNAYADTLPETVSVQEFVEILKKGDIIEYLKKTPKFADKAKQDL